GDVLLGLPSSGAHSNGYSLIRKIIARSNVELSMKLHGGLSLADALLAPTRIYVKPMLAVLRELPVKGMAHITGGGLTGNVPRILPDTVRAEIAQSAWRLPELFQWLQKEGAITDSEMHRVFNCGIGLVVVVAREDTNRALRILRDAGEPAVVIGAVKPRADGQAATLIV
ncbi:MAG TPA: AIR synthase-related protein, partial [Accumulibacter sp.]|nr:AIR synthase-related protein [Accumulibacter sp.]